METASLFKGITNSSLRSPIRYPGGKTRAIKSIRPCLPSNLDLMVSPFFGGGSLELACVSEGIRVVACDIFEPLINFWKYLRQDPDELANLVQSYYPMNRQWYRELHHTFYDIACDFERAAVFFVINRCSFSGLGLASVGYSEKTHKFTQSSIDYLRGMQLDNVMFFCQHWKQTLEDYGDEFMYLDPPYMITADKLYGGSRKAINTHKNFDHEGLAERLKACPRWVLSYNDCDAVRQMYADYEIKEVTWANTIRTSTAGQKTELLILNV